MIDGGCQHTLKLSCGIISYDYNAILMPLPDHWCLEFSLLPTVRQQLHTNLYSSTRVTMSKLHLIRLWDNQMNIRLSIYPKEARCMETLPFLDDSWPASGCSIDRLSSRIIHWSVIRDLNSPGRHVNYLSLQLQSLPNGRYSGSVPPAETLYIFSSWWSIRYLNMKKNSLVCLTI